MVSCLYDKIKTIYRNGVLMMKIRELSSSLRGVVELARGIREKNFQKKIYFSRPTLTTVISLTGNACDLDCAHCGGKYLEHMTTVEEAESLIRSKGSTSCLISGGCTQHGNVALDVSSIESVVDGLKVNSHVGLISEEEMQTLATIVDCVSFDFLVDEDTIREVYHLEKTGLDYIQTYQMLRKYAKVMPHICIGLKGGEIKGEYRAIDTLVELGADGLVFIIFIPTKGTLYADRQPPDLEEVVKVLAYAREKFPTIPIHLGCMRPAGRYRAELDYYAVEVGVNKLVNPTPPAVRRAEELGYEIVVEQECCVL